MTLKAASKALGVHTGTLRKWIRQGAPTLELGSVGRTHGTQVDPEAIKRWRAERAVPSLTHTAHHDTLQTLTTILSDTIKRDIPSYHSYLSEVQLMFAALIIFQRAVLNITREPLTDLPPDLKPFRAIVLDSMERGTFHQRR